MTKSLTGLASAAAFLFDMDGTLLDSTPAVLATWEYFAREYSLDLTEVLKTSHGVRTIDNMRRWCGLEDPEQLQAATNLFESMIVAEAQRLQSEGQTGLEILPGVQVLLDELQSSAKPLWAVVTSATTVYASAALPTAGIPQPPKLITADHVTKGKPHPEPYLTGAKQLGVEAHDCIVVEDAPSGVKSGVAAGSKVLAVCTSHEREQLQGIGATWIVNDLSKVQASIVDGRIHLVIDQSP
ncbi:hypothetical protein EHS25_009435 [Saitozyma podzolica]|uniref:Glycerol-1-phosphatase n=1 Tax=Saitozyma podzolica TaxID=1890683 RepID=A0A427YLS4_9TREE|nr:hypothetical protein EHS25_009435 [Saitozyma podzolica]